MNNYSVIRARGYLVIEGQEIEINYAATANEPNAIPKAFFGVAVGRKGPQLQPAAIHRLRASIAATTKVECRISLEETDGRRTIPIPNGEFVLFEGYLSGLQMTRQGNQFNPVITATHWLADMDYSSSLSQSSHPTNPSNFSYRASHKAGGTGASKSYSPFKAVGRITPTTLAADFWGQGLRPWLEEVCSLDRINADELAGLGIADGGANTDALRALNRFSSSAGGYVPLALDMRGLDSNTIAAGVWKAVQQETFESFANTTLWGKLIGDFSPNYMFSVIPRILDAIVVPFVPGLRIPHVTVPAEDYSVLSFSSQLERTLRGVGIFSGIAAKTGATSAARLGIGGWYSPVASGMVMMKQGPRWLTQLVNADRYSSKAMANGARPIGNAVQPGIPVAAGPDGDPLPPDQVVNQAKTLFDKYAQTLYAYETLRLRQMSFGGPLRFDIAPGSTIILETASDKFISADKLAIPLIGDVMRVTTSINFGETGQASTMYNIGHVRTAEENSQEGFSLDEHPLWQNSWPGAAMVDS